MSSSTSAGDKLNDLADTRVPRAISAVERKEKRRRKRLRHFNTCKSKRAIEFGQLFIQGPEAYVGVEEGCKLPLIHFPCFLMRSQTSIRDRKENLFQPPSSSLS